MTDLLVLDVSQYQGGIDHRAVVGYLRSTCGGAAIMVRICFGDLVVDTRADQNIDGFRAAGADVLGWYLYLVAGRDPTAQGAALGRVILAHGGLRRNEVVVVDDEETTGGDESPRVNAALAELDQQLQVADPAGEDWWYSGLDFALAHLRTARGRRWIAAYQESEPTAIPHDLWQRTDAATVPGISGPVDASVYHGSIADLRRLIGVPGDPVQLARGGTMGTIAIAPRTDGSGLDRFALTADGAGISWNAFTPDYKAGGEQLLPALGDGVLLRGVVACWISATRLVVRAQDEAGTEHQNAFDISNGWATAAWGAWEAFPGTWLVPVAAAPGAALPQHDHAFTGTTGPPL